MRFLTFSHIISIWIEIDRCVFQANFLFLSKTKKTSLKSTMSHLDLTTINVSDYGMISNKTEKSSIRSTFQSRSNNYYGYE